MVIRLSPDLEAALNESARQQGMTPDVLAINILQERILPPLPPRASQDEWERVKKGSELFSLT